jgi:hypothetical protein
MNARIWRQISIVFIKECKQLRGWNFDFIMLVNTTQHNAFTAQQKKKTRARKFYLAFRGSKMPLSVDASLPRVANCPGEHWALVLPVIL